jgi:uncharacterized membrane protein YgdD (TMEM256/DUF423 family)
MRKFLEVGALLAFLGVAAGAFGAHWLRERVPAEMLEVFRTGALYQMIHALALVALGSSGARLGSWGERSAWLFIVGTVLFSGSLYALALSGVRVWGAVTPLGGICFLAGWLCLFVAARQSDDLLGT